MIPASLRPPPPPGGRVCACGCAWGVRGRCGCWAWPGADAWDPSPLRRHLCN